MKYVQKKYSPFKPSVKADVIRLHGRYSLGLLIKSFLQERPFRPVFTMRLCQAVATSSSPVRFLLPFCKLFHGLMRNLAGMDFSWKTSIGPGFCMTHGWGTVVGARVTIGRNVTVFHGVTIGRKETILENGERIIAHPTLEDDVWVGTQAIIVGGVTIGKGSRIAPGTVVTGDVAPHTIVGGNPIRVIKTNAVPDVSNPAPVE